MWEVLVERGCEDFVIIIDLEMIVVAIVNEVDKGKDWVEGIIVVLIFCVGVYSLVIGILEGIIGVRDFYGICFLVIGVLEEEIFCYVLVLEICVLDIIGVIYVCMVEVGELVYIIEFGLVFYWLVESVDCKFCVFEMIYFFCLDSVVNDESFYIYCMCIGKYLVKEFFVDVDFVMGVFDFGILVAIGFF